MKNYDQQQLATVQNSERGNSIQTLFLYLRKIAQYWISYKVAYLLTSKEHRFQILHPATVHAYLA